MYATSFLKFLKPPSASFENISITTRTRIFFTRSSCNRLAFSQIMPSETLLPANILSFIQISSNFSTSSIVCDICLVITVTLLATSAFLIVFLFLGRVQIVDFAIPNWVARSETRTPFSSFGYDFFPNIYHDIGIFSFHFAAIITFLWPHGVLFKEKAQWIRVNKSYTATDALAYRCCWLVGFSARSCYYEYYRHWYSQLNFTRSWRLACS